MKYPDYIDGLITLTYDMWKKGWDEYNGGNVSYRLKESEVANLSEDLALTDYVTYHDEVEVEVMDIPQNMQDQYLLISASWSHFRHLKNQPANDSGIIRLTKKVISKLQVLTMENVQQVKFLCIFSLTPLAWSKMTSKELSSIIMQLI